MLIPGCFGINLERQYSFYSNVHQTFSRIDYFVIDARWMTKVTDIKYHLIIISDHAPLSMDMEIAFEKRYAAQWRFNVSLLSDDKFHIFIKKAILGA